MAPPDVTAIEELLARTIGLEPTRLGRAPLQHAVQCRMQATGALSVRAYVERLVRDEAEHLALVEELVVPETWFFRDEGPFRLLQQTARARWAGLYPQPVVRVLCAPCSTGEEAYSVVIALLRAGMRPESIRVDAVDISGRLLEVAKAGVYGLNSFRGKDLSFREIYCQQLAPGIYEMDPMLVRQIRWHRMNILQGLPTPDYSGEPRPDPSSSSPTGDEMDDGRGYDVIFCRNLFIYLTPQARSRLLGHFRRKLKQDGIFFVGHAEAMSLDSRYFVPTGEPGQFAYRLYTEKDRAAEAAEEAARLAENIPWYADRPVTVPKPVPLRPAISRLPALSEGLAAPATPPPRSAVADNVEARDKERTVGVPAPLSGAVRMPLPLRPVADGVTPADANMVSPLQAKLSAPDASALVAKALKLADSGQYEQAERKCEEALGADRFHAGAHCLFGVIAEARGGAALAERCYRRAVYLDPRHRQALVHLSLLMQKRGNHAEARVLRERAERQRDSS
ncbi:MAG: CheR family methyltransferase [Candidatus Methylacidiphilales bacterium]|nr:CheR family methyltransferase [Candidatus Methylacidiphilales bacterium]